MSHWAEGAHPMCICGPVTFGKVKGVVTRDGCRQRAKSLYGIDPHPVIDENDLKKIMAQFRERLDVTA